MTRDAASVAPEALAAGVLLTAGRRRLAPVTA